MGPPSHDEGAGAIGAYEEATPSTKSPPRRDALTVSRGLPLVTADAALAVIAYPVNRAVSGQIPFAHLLGELAHAQARELSTAGAQAMPNEVLRHALVSTTRIEARFADGVIDAANRYGRSFAHLAFAFPVSSRGPH